MRSCRRRLEVDPIEFRGRAGLIFGALQQRGLTEPITLVPADSTLQDLVMVLFALGISAVVLTIFSGTSEQVATGIIEGPQLLKPVGGLLACQ